MELGTTATDKQQFRCNAIDHKGTVSFVAPPHGLKVLAAAISRGAESVSDLIAQARRYDEEWAVALHRDLMIFDEYNVDDIQEPFEDAIGEETDLGHRAFRVMDQMTRQRSLKPGGLGLVVFNMKERRIIQIQNSYDDLRRRDRGRVRVDGEPTERIFHYELPEEWALVP